MSKGINIITYLITVSGNLSFFSKAQVVRKELESRIK